MEIEQKPRKFTNVEKEAVCEKYEPYLKIINDFGNKMMLMKQLEEFSGKLELSPNPTAFVRQIQELAEADIIRTEPFYVSNIRGTQHRIVVLKKFALRYLKGETRAGGSQKVSPVPKVKSNERILLSIFKCNFVLEKLIPSLQKRKEHIGLADIYDEIGRKDMSILCERNKGILYAKHFYKKFNKFLAQGKDDSLKYQIAELQKEMDKRLEGLKKGFQSVEGKGKASISKSGIQAGKVTEKAVGIHKKETKKKGEQPFSAKTLKLNNFSFETMVRANIHIIGVKELYTDEGDPRGLEVTAVLFDYNNSQDIYNLGRQIACFYQMLHGFMGKNPTNIELYYDLYLRVGIAGYDKDAIANIKEKAEEKIYSRTVDGYEERLKLTFLNWTIKMETQENHLKIFYTDYNITDKYLEGKKYANLLQGRPQKEEIQKEEMEK